MTKATKVGDGAVGGSPKRELSQRAPAVTTAVVMLKPAPLPVAEMTGRTQDRRVSQTDSLNGVTNSEWRRQVISHRMWLDSHPIRPGPVSDWNWTKN